MYNNATTNGIHGVLNIDGCQQVTNPANGDGAMIQWAGKAAGTPANVTLSMAYETVYFVTSSASNPRTAYQLSLTTGAGTVLAPRFTVDGAGGIQFNAFTSVGAVTAGTPIGHLSYDANGNVIAGALVTGGSANISDAAYDASWNGDTTNGASKNALFDIISTLGGAQNLQSVTTTGSTTNTGIIFASAGGGASVKVLNNATGASLGNMTLRAEGTNVSTVFAINPMGTGGSATFKSQISLWNTDGVADPSTNFELLRMRAAGTNGYIFNAVAGGTGVVYGYKFQTSDTTRFEIATSGAIYMPTLGTATTANVIYFDTATGLLTYGATPASGGDMVKNALNTMGASGQIIFGSSLDTDSQFKIGSNEFQDTGSGLFYWMHNARYVSGTGLVHRTTGESNILSNQANVWSMALMQSGTAGTAVNSSTNVLNFAIDRTNKGMRLAYTGASAIEDTYFNFAINCGSGFPGFRWNATTSKVQVQHNTTDGWIDIGSGGGGVTLGNTSNWTATQSFPAIRFYTTGSGRNVTVTPNSGSDNYGSIQFVASGINSSVNFDIIPAGTGFSAGNKGTIGLYNTDVIADSTNFAVLRIRAAGTTGYTINSSAAGTGTVGDMLFQTAGTTRLSLLGAGAIRFNGLAGNGAGYIAVDNNGQISWAAGSGGGTTINNNANNRLITGSDTANTLEGEANATWNGDIMELKGTAANTYYHGTGVTQPFTFSSSWAGTMSGRVGVLSSTNGGMLLQGFSGADTAGFLFQGHIGHATPTVAAVQFAAFKTNGSDDRTDLSATEKAYSFFNNTSEKVTIYGNGKLRLSFLAGNGAGYIAIDNNGDISYSAGAGGGVTLANTDPWTNSQTMPGLFFTTTGGGVSLKFTNTSTSSVQGNIYMQAQGTNVTTVLAVAPNGTGGSATFKSQISLWNTDGIADNSTNFELLRMRAAGTSGYTFNAVAGGTGVLYGISFQTADITRLGIAASGEVTFNGAYTMPTAIGTNGQGFKVAASGTVLEWGSWGLIGIRVIQQGTTSYTPTTGTTKIRMILVGGGAGGGGVAGTNSQVAVGGGGASGGTLEKVIAVTITAYTCSVGTGGGGGANTGAVGTNGGDTTLTIGATTYTARGGVGGNFVAPAAAVGVAAGGAAGAVSSNGDVNGKGAPGMPGIRHSGTIGISGSGGSTPYGGGGVGIAAAAAGNNGEGYGAGGGGAISTANVGRAGGNGSNGVIIIYEYA